MAKVATPRPAPGDRKKIVGSLAGRLNAIQPGGEKAVQIPLRRVMPDPNQPRQAFNAAELRELTESIQSVGVRNPIEVRANPDPAWPRQRAAPAGPSPRCRSW